MDINKLLNNAIVELTESFGDSMADNEIETKKNAEKAAAAAARDPEEKVREKNAEKADKETEEWKGRDPEQRVREQKAAAIETQEKKDAEFRDTAMKAGGATAAALAAGAGALALRKWLKNRKKK